MTNIINVAGLSRHTDETITRKASKTMVVGLRCKGMGRAMEGRMMWREPPDHLAWRKRVIHIAPKLNKYCITPIFRVE